MSGSAAAWPVLAAAAAACALGCVEPAPGAGGKRRATEGRTAPPDGRSPVRPAHPAHAVFGGAIELVGWDLEPPSPAPGEWMALTLHWRALEELDASWRVFVHLDSREGEERLNADHLPAGGYPTDRWRRGEVVRDPIRIRVPAGYLGQAIEAWVGWFSGEERMHITNASEVRHDGEDRLLLTVIPLRRPGGP